MATPVPADGSPIPSRAILNTTGSPFPTHKGTMKNREVVPVGEQDPMIEAFAAADARTDQWLEEKAKVQLFWKQCQIDPNFGESFSSMDTARLIEVLVNDQYSADDMESMILAADLIFQSWDPEIPDQLAPISEQQRDGLLMFFALKLMSKSPKLF